MQLGTIPYIAAKMTLIKAQAHSHKWVYYDSTSTLFRVFYR